MLSISGKTIEHIIAALAWPGLTNLTKPQKPTSSVAAFAIDSSVFKSPPSIRRQYHLGESTEKHTNDLAMAHWNEKYTSMLIHCQDQQL